MLPELRLLAVNLGCGAVIFAAAAPCVFAQTVQTTQAAPAGKAAASLEWDSTFVDRSGTRPLHFVAEYKDAHGMHRLEEWRTGQTHLRRQTDDRIDLHADARKIPAKGQPVDYLWQIVDMQKKIDNLISSGAMFRAGMFYSYYSMAHVVTRPAGHFRLSALSGRAPDQVAGHTCGWYELTPEGQAATQICWSAELGIPLRMQAPAGTGMMTIFEVKQVDQNAIPATLYVVKTAELTVRNHDQMAEDD